MSQPNAVIVSAVRTPIGKFGGMVTAGNSSGINDGAAALLIMSERKAAEPGLLPLAVIRSHASTGVEPAMMGLGPIPASRLALAKAGLSMADIHLLEINEAFVAQALTYSKHYDFAPDIFNVTAAPSPWDIRSAAARESP